MYIERERDKKKTKTKERYRERESERKEKNKQEMEKDGGIGRVREMGGAGSLMFVWHMLTGENSTQGNDIRVSPGMTVLR